MGERVGGGGGQAGHSWQERELKAASNRSQNSRLIILREDLTLRRKTENFETWVAKGPGEKQKKSEKESDEEEARKNTEQPPVSDHRQRNSVSGMFCLSSFKSR